MTNAARRGRPRGRKSHRGASTDRRHRKVLSMGRSLGGTVQRGAPSM